MKNILSIIYHERYKNITEDEKQKLFENKKNVNCNYKKYLF